MNIYKRVLLTLVCVSIFNVSAQEKPKFELIHKQVTDNFYLITSNNKTNVTHVGLVVGKDGLLLVDSYFESKAEELYQAIRKISDKPLKYVINTHSHPDHSGGNKFFAEQGAIIISQNNSRYTDAFGQLRFNDSISIDLGGEVMTAAHIVSHTYDDAIVYLENSNVIFMGDNLSTHTFLSIGEKGLAGHLSAFDLAISMSNDETMVIPAHAAFNDVGIATLKKKDLYSYKTKFTAWVDKLTQLQNKNTSVADMMKNDELNQLTLEIAADGDKDLARTMLEGPGHEQIIGIALKSLFSKSHNLSDTALDKYIGKYRSVTGINTEIIKESGKLYVREQGKFIAELLPLTKQKFLIKGYFFGIGEGEETIDFAMDSAGFAKALTPAVNDNSVWKTEMNFEKRSKI